MEIECRQCKKIFESEDEIEKHEDDGRECEQCDLCGEYLCHGMSIERHKKREHGTTGEEEKGGITGEMIKDKNDGQECEKWEKWQYDGSKSKIHKENYDGYNRKRHKKKKQKSTGKKGNKEGDKKNHEKG